MSVGALSAERKATHPLTRRVAILCLFGSRRVDWRGNRG
ncbi:MAG: hypothetical protein ACI814_001934 [Mariniblastus sp.]|jgi:hypothetical protein